MVYVFLAPGYEEIEAITVVDILRRAGVVVSTVSMDGDKIATGAHNIPLIADLVFDDCDFSEAELLYLPGGLPGATNLDAHQGLRDLLLSHNAKGGWIAAVCAAPLVLGHLGLTKGKTCTCYPGFESELGNANYTGGMVEVDGNIITGRGPAACMELGYTILKALGLDDAADQIREGMMYNQLMGK